MFSTKVFTYVGVRVPGIDSNHNSSSIQSISNCKRESSGKTKEITQSAQRKSLLRQQTTAQTEHKQKTNNKTRKENNEEPSFFSPIHEMQQGNTSGVCMYV